MNNLSRMTETLLAEFRYTCYSKCGSVTIESDDDDEEEEEEFRYSSDESEDEWGELVVSSTPPTSPADTQPTTASHHVDLPNRSTYRLIDFKKGVL